MLLGDLMFMGKCILSISNKMQRYTVYLYLETALHVSGGTSIHHQENIGVLLGAHPILHISRIKVNWDGKPSVRADNPDNWIFL
jgi:hypothetical protein